MKTFKNLLCVTFLILIAYSCEPEELPDNSISENQKITASTGDQDDEVVERKENDGD
ncbi:MULTISPECIES: hypothetical protein [Flavobacteriaceae]|jgi:hypothetical protein|uniref:Uncharacterized protein n=1 Tax=Galbibacter orientalis DSM 19592 TaxID=926559 RepID=I3C0G7_9FLAO|nr:MULTISPECIES: hypothetical protein [Flavobacteriaceae]EIJ37110.1 hypothetical protein JoomaDRAFT_0048 [Galbibacter orientalis DSM 19592]MCC4228546.1 hypothetical protein [Zunongwangia profunda]|tara:strand:+ start:528 stop:698 length:171 start_codon:yes stop_codon:yes gene_type:complete